MNVIYERHPVSRVRKAELRKQGLKIIDARFAPPGEAVEHQPAARPQRGRRNKTEPDEAS